MIRRTHTTLAAHQRQQHCRRQPPRQQQLTPAPLLLPALLLVVLLVPLAGAFTVDVAAGASECFTAVASTGEEVFGNFEVLTEGSYTPVEVTVRSWVRACGLRAAMNGMVGWLDRMDRPN